MQASRSLARGTGLTGNSPRHVVCPEGIDERAFVAFEAHRDRASYEPRLEGMCPGLEGFWLVFEMTALPGVVANGLSADIVLGIGPIDAHEGGQCFLRRCGMGHLLGCARVVSRDMRACVLRRHDREPVARQTLRVR